MSSPPTLARPRVGLTKPAKIRSKVVLPHRDVPNFAILDPNFEHSNYNLIKLQDEILSSNN
jgi:hypothetical protein